MYNLYVLIYMVDACPLGGCVYVCTLVGGKGCWGGVVCLIYGRKQMKARGGNARIWCVITVCRVHAGTWVPVDLDSLEFHTTAVLGVQYGSVRKPAK